jgi:hypothetical protein
LVLCPRNKYTYIIYPANHKDTIQKASANKIVIQCSSTELPTVVSYVSSQPQVHWVEEAGQAKFTNKYSTKIMQDAQNEQDTKIWDKGITGNYPK